LADPILINFIFLSTRNDVTKYENYSFKLLRLEALVTTALRTPFASHKSVNHIFSFYNH